MHEHWCECRAWGMNIKATISNFDYNYFAFVWKKESNQNLLYVSDHFIHRMCADVQRASSQIPYILHLSEWVAFSLIDVRTMRWKFFHQTALVRIACGSINTTNALIFSESHTLTAYTLVKRKNHCVRRWVLVYRVCVFSLRVLLSNKSLEMIRSTLPAPIKCGDKSDDDYVDDNILCFLLCAVRNIMNEKIIDKIREIYRSDQYKSFATSMPPVRQIKTDRICAEKSISGGGLEWWVQDILSPARHRFERIGKS